MDEMCEFERVEEDGYCEEDGEEDRGGEVDVLC